MKIGLRPFSSRLSICDRVTFRCTEADSVCSVWAEAVTSTVSVAAPTASWASTARVELGFSLLLALSNFLKPAASTDTE